MCNRCPVLSNGAYLFIFICCIYSSIWSNELETIDDNDINEAMDSESSLDFKFSSISINSKKLKTSTDWPTFDKSSAISDNEKNTLFECISAKKNLWPVNDFRSLQADWKQQAAEIADKEHLDEMMSFLKKSFMKLNHNGECSSFAEVLPRSQSSVKVSTKRVAVCPCVTWILKLFVFGRL